MTITLKRLGVLIKRGKAFKARTAEGRESIVMMALLQFGGPYTSSTYQVLVAVIAIIIMFVVMMVVWVQRYKKVPPNKAMLVSGGAGQILRLPDGRQLKAGFRIIGPGKGTFVWPAIERIDMLSLELMPVEGTLEDFSSGSGQALIYRGQVKIGGDEASIAWAAERFLSKQPSQIAALAGQVLEDVFRRTIADFRSAEIWRKPEQFENELLAAAVPVLAGLGLALEHLSIEAAPAAK